MLEPSADSGRCYSGFGRPEVRAPGAERTARQEQLLPMHLVRIAREVERQGDPTIPLVRLPFLEKGR